MNGWAELIQKTENNESQNYIYHPDGANATNDNPIHYGNETSTSTLEDRLLRKYFVSGGSDDLNTEKNQNRPSLLS